MPIGLVMPEHYLILEVKKSVGKWVGMYLEVEAKNPK
jgi:hypothetical protein